MHTGRLDSLMRDNPARERETGEDVLLLQPGITLEQSLEIVARSQHSENVLDREPVSANDGLSAEDIGIPGDTFDQVVFARGGHGGHLRKFESMSGR